jgi:hypothetical protein
MEVHDGSGQETDGGPAEAEYGSVCAAEARVGFLRYIAQNIAVSRDAKRLDQVGTISGAFYMQFLSLPLREPQGNIAYRSSQP